MQCYPAHFRLRRLYYDLPPGYDGITERQGHQGCRSHQRALQHDRRKGGGATSVGRLWSRSVKTCDDCYHTAVQEDVSDPFKGEHTLQSKWVVVCTEECHPHRMAWHLRCSMAE